MNKALIIGVILVALFIGAKMLTQNETVAVGNFAALSENVPLAQRQVGFSLLFEPPASAKELTPAQKKLEELGFHSDRFHSTKIKNK